jgi:hypothetical protein
MDQLWPAEQQGAAEAIMGGMDEAEESGAVQEVESAWASQRHYIEETIKTAAADNAGVPNSWAKLPYAVPEASDFARDGDESDLRDFIPAPDVAQMAAYIMAIEPTLFSHLAGVSVDYLWALEGGNEHGSPRLGNCQKTRREVKHYAGVSFLIWLAADNMSNVEASWRDVYDSTRHQLLHCERTTDGKLRVRPHDFNGFVLELDNKGHKPRHLRPAARQLGLPL